MNRSFEFVYTNIDWDFAREKLTQSIYNIMAQEELKKVKLGLIGHQAPGFLDFHPHPFLMYEKFGCIMQHISLGDFFRSLRFYSK